MESTMRPGTQLAVRPYPAHHLEVLIEEVLRRATCRAALASAYARGRNNREFADQLAVTEMRNVLNEMLPIGAEVVIGEGERDEAPMLHIGERLGPNTDLPPQLLIAVDPLEGTNLCAHWIPGAICVIAATIVGEGTLWGGIDGYMEKFIVGANIADKLFEMRSQKPHHAFSNRFAKGNFILDQPIEETVALISHFTGKPTTSIVGELLNRKRNEELIHRLRRMHVQVRLISDGDVTSAWRALSDADDDDVDFYLGIGAAAEGVIGAAMANVAGGYMEGRCWFPDDSTGVLQRERLEKKDIDVHKVYSLQELAGGHVMIAFTAVTDGVLPGVSYRDGGIACTHTIAGRSRTGTYYQSTGTHKNPPSAPSNWPLNGDEK